MNIGPKFLRSLHAGLIKLHTDLLQIHESTSLDTWESERVLIPFERLVLVLEDRRFFKHDGIDWRAATREVLKKLVGKKHGGASTIDMQFVRTATGYKQLTLTRKLYEMVLAYLIQYRYSKLTILRSYLAIAFFGSHLYGAEKASSKLYGKNLDVLSPQEAAELAAMLVYPRPRIGTEEWRLRIERRATYGLKVLKRLEKRFDQIPPREQL
jgi:monofunctional glycosyltransferase